MRVVNDVTTLEMPLSGGRGALVGYARISTPDQDIDTQIQALESAGCHEVFTDVANGANTVMPGFDMMLSHLRQTDTLVVCNISCLGRSLSHLIWVMGYLHERGIGFRSLGNTSMDTTAGESQLFSIFADLADFERELRRERSKVALIARKAKGITGGRRQGVTPVLLQRARELIDKNGKALSVRKAAAELNVSKTALYRALSGLSDYHHKKRDPVLKQSPLNKLQR